MEEKRPAPPLILHFAFPVLHFALFRLLNRNGFHPSSRPPARPLRPLVRAREHDLPPDEPTLLDRLRGRARDSADDITRRFRAAKREIHMAKGSRAFDHMVINDNLDRAVVEIRRLIKHKKTGAL